MTRIGIYGGTFDPFTEAHYAIVKSVIANDIVDKVIIMPSRVSYYRQDKTQLFHEKSRVDIINEFVKGDNNIILDSHEYSIPKDENRRYLNMLEYCIANYSSSSENDKEEFYTIIGGDSYNNFKSWFKYDEILSKSKLITITRNEKLNLTDEIPTIILDIGDYYKDVSASKIREEHNRTSEETVEEFKNRYIANIEILKKNMIIERKIASTPIFDLVEVEKSNYPFRPVRIKSKDWASIIVEKEGKILTVRQLRYGIDAEMTELPCGIVEDGENPMDAAIRELKEETGYVVKIENVRYLGSDFANPAFMTNKMHYFYVKMDGSEILGETNLDEHEKLTSEWIDEDVFLNMFGKGTVSVFMKNVMYRYLSDVRGRKET